MRQSAGRGESAVTQATLRGVISDGLTTGSHRRRVAAHRIGYLLASVTTKGEHSTPRGKKEQAEQIIPKLREVEVAAGRGKTVGEVGSKLDEL